MLVRRMFLSRETEREIPLLVKYSNNEYQNEKTGVIEDCNEEWNKPIDVKSGWRLYK